MSALHGKITVEEILDDEELFEELVEQLNSTPRAVRNQLKRYHAFMEIEDLYDYVPDSLRWVKVIDAREDPDLREEIATLSRLELDEVEETLADEHGSSYVHTVIEFPWPQPDPDEEDETPEVQARGDAVSSEDSALTVLLVSASPENEVRLRVDREFRSIIARLRGTKYREHLRIVQCQAVTYGDLRTALLEHEPHVLHFSGHGEPDGSLLFEELIGGAERVSKKKLLRLLSALAGNLRLVVFNACHSVGIASDIPPTIELAIGMANTISDHAAIDFAVALYEALAFNKSVQTAFNAAVAGLGDEECPELFPTQDPEGKRLRPLLRLSGFPQKTGQGG